MKLLRALRPALARREVLARQHLSQTVVRIPALHPRQYSTEQDKDAVLQITTELSRPPAPKPSGPTRRPTDWEKTVFVQQRGLKVMLPPILALPRQMRRSLFTNMWLRDNCRCSSCVNQDTMQRNFDTFQLPENIHIVRAWANHTNVHVEWSDGHRSAYRWDFLRHYIYDNARLDFVPSVFWDLAPVDPPTVEHEDVMENEGGVGRLTMKIGEFGYCFVNDVPREDPDETRKLLERIAFIRQTHYGGFYDFKPDLAMADTAYTNQALALHTDNTYFSDPAGLQAFHLLSHEGGKGGTSVLLDGFEAARILEEEDRRAYKILSEVGVPWHASGNKGINIRPYKNFPVFERLGTGPLIRIRWNNDDRGVVPFGQYVGPDQWYTAARKWNEIINRKELQSWFQLKPGKVLIFDNWRMLHGRSSFRGVRRICGGYINMDDFRSRWANTNLNTQQNRDRAIG